MRRYYNSESVMGRRKIGPMLPGLALAGDSIGVGDIRWPWAGCSLLTVSELRETRPSASARNKVS